jgi:hypothetical protein
MRMGATGMKRRKGRSLNQPVLGSSPRGLTNASHPNSIEAPTRRLFVLVAWVNQLSVCQLVRICAERRATGAWSSDQLTRRAQTN